MPNLSPGGAKVNSQGRQPLDDGANSRMRAPKGREPASSSNATNPSTSSAWFAGVWRTRCIETRGPHNPKCPVRTGFCSPPGRPFDTILGSKNPSPRITQGNGSYRVDNEPSGRIRWRATITGLGLTSLAIADHPHLSYHQVTMPSPFPRREGGPRGLGPGRFAPH